MPFGAEKSTNLTHLGKMQKFAECARALRYTNSSLVRNIGQSTIALAEELESEYLSVKEELAEDDGDSDIESYLEDVRGAQY